MEAARVQQPITIPSCSGTTPVRPPLNSPSSSGQSPPQKSPAQSPPNNAPVPSPANGPATQSPRRGRGSRAGGGAGPSDAAGAKAKPKATGEQDEEYRKKVIVSGYPKFAQPQDLTYAFAKIGAARVQRCGSHDATLAFDTVEEAQAALRASRRVFVLGQLLVVVPSKPGGDKRAPAKQDFTRSKQKGQTVAPQQIPMSGDFHHQLDAVLAAVRLTQEHVAGLGSLYLQLEAALQPQWPGCTAVPFGSITTGLGIRSSDADCFIRLPPAHRAGPHVQRAKRLLQLHPRLFAEVLAIPRANTPIVKFLHLPTATNCDVTFKTPLGAQNSKLIAFLLHLDPRLLPMAVLVKYWAKVHELTGTGKLTNYALTMMMVFYLQQPPASILPSVESLQRDRANDVMVDFWNTGFDTRGNPSPSPSAASIAELLGGFFQYYSTFDFEKTVVCPYLGVPVEKKVFEDVGGLPDEFALYRSNVANQNVYPLRLSTAFCVQDPFEQCHNVASSVTGKLASDIKTYLKFAADAYEKEKLNDCRDFLKTILLQKPKIVRSKANPEYRINLFPRIINTIASAEWKPIVRDLVMVIFESMLKIKLGKVEEKVNPDTKKEKEKYSGAITRAIWKRKQFSKLYTAIDMAFQQKQEKITEEILNVEKQVIALQFQLTLTFCHNPKSAVVTVRMGGGEMEAFREFGKCLISVFQNWFVQLLKPYARPNPKDTATKIAETIDVLDGNVNDIETDDEEFVSQEVDDTDEANVTISEDGDEPDGTDKPDATRDLANLTNNKLIINVAKDTESERNEICALVPPT